MNELKTLGTKMHDLQGKYSDQARLLASVVSHSKNPAANNSAFLNNSMLNQDGA